MKQLLDQTRKQMSSSQSFIHLLEIETQGDILKILKQNTADIRRILRRAESIHFINQLLLVLEWIHRMRRNWLSRRPIDKHKLLQQRKF